MGGTFSRRGHPSRLWNESRVGSIKHTTHDEGTTAHSLKERSASSSAPLRVSSAFGPIPRQSATSSRDRRARSSKVRTPFSSSTRATVAFVFGKGVDSP